MLVELSTKPYAKTHMWTFLSAPIKTWYILEIIFFFLHIPTTLFSLIEGGEYMGLNKSVMLIHLSA